MAGGGPWRRGGGRGRTLRNLMRQTQRAVAEVAHILSPDPQILSTINELSSLADSKIALVLLGAGEPVARLLKTILGIRVLPYPVPRGRRWLRIRYGSQTQVQIVVGNAEFELVEELECNKQSWDTLPLQELLREDKSDLTTVVEIEINNAFLKDGPCIIVPPDLDLDPDPKISVQDLKLDQKEFLDKRKLILKNYEPIYLCPFDRFGKNIFKDEFKIRRSSVKNPGEFWSSFNLYCVSDSIGSDCDSSDECFKRPVADQPFVFNTENCLDFYQIKDLNPKAQVLFVLFSDSVGYEERDRCTGERDGEFSEATESSEVYYKEELPESDRSFVEERFVRDEQKKPLDRRRLYEMQCCFLNDVLEQWENMSPPTQKHDVKSKWIILNDKEITRTPDKKSLNKVNKNSSQNASDSLLDWCTSKEDREVYCRNVFLNKVVKFAAETHETFLLECFTRLSEVHVKLVQQFILASFDLARELQVVPKKIHYVAKQEQLLYETILHNFTEGYKKQELTSLMQEVLDEMKVEIDMMDWSIDDLPCHQDRNFEQSNSVFYDSNYSASLTNKISEQIQNLSEQNKFNKQNRSRFYTPTENIPLKNKKIGQNIHSPHQNNLPGQNNIPGQNPYLPGQNSISEKNGNSPGQSRVNWQSEQNRDNLNNTIDDFVSASDGRTDSDVEEAESYDSFNFDDYDIIEYSDSYDRFFRRQDLSIQNTNSIRVEGELSRGSYTRSSGVHTCTHSMQISVKQATLDVQMNVLNGLSRRISQKLVTFVDCLKDTYFGTLNRCLASLELQVGVGGALAASRALSAAAAGVTLCPRTYTAVYSALDVLRRLVQRVWVGRSAECVLSARWRRRAAAHALRHVTAARLASLTCAQITERLAIAHEKYQSSLLALEAALASKLHHTEDVKLAIRKRYAPKFARLCLESTSMCDLLTYGSPELGREIGRGQYGVVYSCMWAGTRAAVKSVMPHDERHYADLAMEFYYTRSIPPHPRVVRLLGSVLAGGPTTHVLLVCERRVRDLHAALRSGLGGARRGAAAADIVCGIRYLHSLGLIHRDIKMKNVLLDHEDRASLTDLGFCACESLISGSVVGTPVHMAPELVTGVYDNTVDIYAFGILFWYICAGSVRLPAAFEACQNKEQLWSKVKKGLRPERLPHFTDECWEIMESCWHSDPSKRALLGDILPKLERMQLEPGYFDNAEVSSSDDDNSINVTSFRSGSIKVG